jgi:N-acetyltransferase
MRGFFITFTRQTDAPFTLFVMTATRIKVPTLDGSHIRLEPLTHRHVDGLAAASAADPSLYQWSPVPQGRSEAEKYVDTALAWQEAGTAASFAAVRQSDNIVIGSTRFFNLEYWGWPPSHSSHGRSEPDAGEIGYTWFAASAIRTPANTEAKLLMLTYAFDDWKVLRICLHTDVRNTRSRAAIERIGGRFEGVLRAHRMAADFIPRDSARYSIIAAEWPAAKEKLILMRDRKRT